SAYSSDNGHGHGHARDRSNSSAAIALALGLSQTPPSNYAKLGGPGTSFGRSGSSRSQSRSRKGSDEREREVYPNASVTANVNGHSRGMSTERTRNMNMTVDTRTATSTVASSSSIRRPGDYNADQDEDNSILTGLSGGSKAQRSNTVQGPSPSEIRDSKPIKLPMRSLTSPQLDRDKALALDGGASASGVRGVLKKTAAGGGARTRRPKTCLRCQKVIEDGRWVSVDNGGVLCEKCWKGMYLPKCRRCNLPIERQAVSSSDGQLKGKYHKECFNCHICHKPFPDRSFYVYDGKPLCAYHYHEANDSLCAAARCGQPIEGPCAVSHTGDRYHPEHMTCEYLGGVSECRESLVKEYWEVDGRMLCERHAAVMTMRGGGARGSWGVRRRRMRGGVEGR
ncbi:hypothetical protein CPB84DRAFT_1901841, partial [Gymnopilus junonius]